MTEASAASDTRPSAPLGLVLMRGALRVLSHAAPSMASRVAADLFMTPRRYARPERERAVLAEGKAFEVRLSQTMTIRGWEWGGDGPVVHLVHGWEGRGSQLAAFVRPLTERGFRVVAWDAPGHGDSAGNRSSLPHFTWALRGVADRTGAPHAIVAHSLGCAAATLALRDGLAAERLVFVAPPLEPADYTARFGEILDLDDAIVARMKERIEERFLRKWSDYSLAATATQMTAPLLVIHDRDDRETYWSEGAALAGGWPGARLVTTVGLGHRRILREAAVIEEAARFIAGAR